MLRVLCPDSAWAAVRAIRRVRMFDSVRRASATLLLFATLALFAGGFQGRAGCVPSERVGEWLTPELEGVPGLLGYRYRLMSKEFLCRIHPETSLDPHRVFLAVYQGLPRGLAMVEYLASPELLMPPGASAKPKAEAEAPASLDPGSLAAFFAERPAGLLQTVVYLYERSPEVEASLRRLLESGEVELLLVRAGLEPPAWVAGYRVAAGGLPVGARARFATRADLGAFPLYEPEVGRCVRAECSRASSTAAPRAWSRASRGGGRASSG